MQNIPLGKYLTLQEFCTCTQTYQKYSSQIEPFPRQTETIQALKELNQFLLDPLIDHFGKDRLRLTYGFCSPDLKKYLQQKDPLTGEKNGRVAPALDQHMSHEINRRGNYYCKRLGAACDFFFLGVNSVHLVDWLLARQLPFDSLYFYGEEKPLHLSYGPQQKRDIWTFTPTGQPTKKGLERWLKK